MGSCISCIGFPYPKIDVYFVILLFIGPNLSLMNDFHPKCNRIVYLLGIAKSPVWI